MLSSVDCLIRESLQDIRIVNHKEPCWNPQLLRTVSAHIVPHASTRARSHADRKTLSWWQMWRRIWSAHFPELLQDNFLHVLLSSGLTFDPAAPHLRHSLACVCGPLNISFCLRWFLLLLLLLVTCGAGCTWHLLSTPSSSVPLAPSSGPSAFSSDKVFVTETTGETPSWWYLARLSFDTTLGPHSA